MKLKSAHKFDARLGKSFCYCSDSSPPDYTPMANASAESARIMGELGQEQLDFAKQQYEENKPFLQGIAQQQMDIADQTAQQGADYFNYLKAYRPTERAMMYEAMGFTPEEAAQLESTYYNGDAGTYERAVSTAGTTSATRRQAELDAIRAQDEADAAIIGGSDTDVYNARRSEIDDIVGRAIADAQGGYTRALNQAVRQGLRYGAAAPNMVGQVGSIGMAQASNTAAAANAAREGGIQKQRGLAQTNLGLRRDINDNITKQKSVDWAKKLDATGLAKGMPGASAGAYGLAISSGNAAGQNQMAPGQAMQAGLTAGANTIGQGRQLYQQGLGNILSAQTQMSGAAMESNGEMGGALVGLAGTAVAVI